MSFTMGPLTPLSAELFACACRQANMISTSAQPSSHADSEALQLQVHQRSLLPPCCNCVHQSQSKHAGEDVQKSHQLQLRQRLQAHSIIRFVLYASSACLRFFVPANGKHVIFYNQSRAGLVYAG